MKTINTTFAALLLGALAIPAFAQAPAPVAPYNIDQRQANQQRRIDEGVKSGELTPRETARLQKGQAHIQKMEDKARADGVVTNKEHVKIAHAQDKQSRLIEREKHDRQRVTK
ncbi:MAG: hypothetical protein WCR74_19575 [Betaproteobacteria bacterium]